MKAKIILCLCFILFFATSCSYVQLENEIRQKMFPGNESKINIDIKPDTNTKLKSMDDTITVNDGIAKLSYKINKVTAYNNFQESGLNSESLCNPEAPAISDSPFVLIDITVTNQKELIKIDFYNIAVFHLLNKEIFSDPWSHLLPAISYFSKSLSTGSDYFHYTLPEGEKMECQLGWFLREPVPTAKDLILHVGADIQSDNYVDLSKTTNTHSED